MWSKVPSPFLKKNYSVAHEQYQEVGEVEQKSLKHLEVFASLRNLSF